MGLRTALTSLLSALSTMSAALGAMMVDCYLNAFAKTASILLRTYTNSNGREYTESVLQLGR